MLDAAPIDLDSTDTEAHLAADTVVGVRHVGVTDTGQVTLVSRPGRGM